MLALRRTRERDLIYQITTATDIFKLPEFKGEPSWRKMLVLHMWASSAVIRSIKEKIRTYKICYHHVIETDHHSASKAYQTGLDQPPLLSWLTTFMLCQIIKVQSLKMMTIPAAAEGFPK